jgi:hypothetical protein
MLSCLEILSFYGSSTRRTCRMQAVSHLPLPSIYIVNFGALSQHLQPAIVLAVFREPQGSSFWNCLFLFLSHNDTHLIREYGFRYFFPYTARVLPCKQSVSLRLPSICIVIPIALSQQLKIAIALAVASWISRWLFLQFCTVPSNL